MAFNKVNHATLVKALAALNLGAVLHTARELATTLLDSSYGEFKLVMVHRVKGKKSTLVIDAWTDVNGKSVINYVRICGDDTYLLETVYTGSTLHSASYLAADIKRVIEVIKFASIAAVVTDNTATNQLVWQTLQADYPKVFFHGCISHVLHLVVKDLVARLPWLKKLEENCRKLLLEGMNALVLPADTRWGTIEKCFVSVLVSESILHSFVSGRDFLKAKNKEQKAKRRMAYDIKVFERNTRPVSDVYNMFLQLPKKFDKISMPITAFAVITTVLRERFDFVYGDAHGVSYLLDPRYAGKDMDNDTREAVVDFIARWNGPGTEDATMIELMKFQAAVQQEARPIKLVLDKRIGVREFWSGVHGYPLLQSVANVVFASACSSAAAERNFSAHKFVHSQIRNRLKDPTSKRSFLSTST
ncbi:hypothetical protein PC110_g14067 [Phytophthora cactorum]|uniref:DUF659 domain-containing protein n=1 Tax=Phytophthora cactorum TaxID=29920 RepID=A0A329RXW1_9STRA|nr:hypothetical protein PC110_g14067 [Phytophthora cactorum]